MSLTLSAPAWMSASGPDLDVVLASRCRVARNVAGYPFPWRATELQLKEVVGAVRDAAVRGGGPLADAESVRSEGLSEEDRERLVEMRYASRHWTQPALHRWLLVGGDGCTSLLVNEEDHLRFQAITPGLQVESATDRARDACRRMAQFLQFAHDDEFGFLTASLGNTGTGLRVSALLHLAGLAALDARESILRAAAEVGCSIRGVYGEGTIGTGEFFQVSNTGTYGTGVSRTVDRVSSAASYLIQSEREARHEALRTPKGRARFSGAVAAAVQRLFEDEWTPRMLLPIVSTLRLGAAEGLLEIALSATAEWVAIAGAHAAYEEASDRFSESYEAVRRSASLRQRLRRLVQSSGTFSTSLAK